MMNWEKTGFSRTESRVICFLIGVFLLGTGLKWIGESSADTVLFVDDSTHYPDSSSVFDIRHIKKELEYKIDINSSKAEDFETIPGIGPVTARRIIEYREQNGRFEQIDQIVNVKGIGPKTLERMKPYIVLEQE